MMWQWLVPNFVCTTFIRDNDSTNQPRPQQNLSFWLILFYAFAGDFGWAKWMRFVS